MSCVHTQKIQIKYLLFQIIMNSLSKMFFYELSKKVIKV